MRWTYGDVLPTSPFRAELVAHATVRAVGIKPSAVLGILSATGVFCWGSTQPMTMEAGVLKPLRSTFDQSLQG